VSQPHARLPAQSSPLLTPLFLFQHTPWLAQHACIASHTHVTHHGGRQLWNHGHVDGDLVSLAHTLALHVVCNLQGVAVGGGLGSANLSRGMCGWVLLRGAQGP
jgi:hypothetical protein